MELKEDYGYDKERFPSLAGESFDCVICTLVVRDPKECTNCGSMFCKACIDGWLLKKKECPKRCALNQTTIKPIGRALHRIYQDLDIRCKYFSTCKQTIKLADIETHEANCNLPKCLNFDFCKNNVKSKNKSELLCDPTCVLFAKIRDCGTDYKKTRKVLEDHFKSYIPSSGPTFSISTSSGTKGGVTSFKWDGTHIGSGIELSSDRKVAYLNEGPYMFRSIIGDTAFTGGINYWEIHGDSRTENELKIGVAAKKEFNYNSAFADYEFGFSYYGLGQLRHGSNASGAPYGKRFKKEGVLGICLDMNKGTLSFALDGEYFGVAYTSELLKKGPIYAAVSLLHCAALKLVTDKPCPEYFLK